MSEDGNASTLYINHANIFKTKFFILTEETKNFTLRNHQKVIHTVENGRQEWETWEQGWEKWETGMGEMGDTSYTHLANISHTY